MKRRIGIGVGIILSLSIAWFMGPSPSQEVVSTPAQIEDIKRQEEQTEAIKSTEATKPQATEQEEITPTQEKTQEQEEITPTQEKTQDQEEITPTQEKTQDQEETTPTISKPQVSEAQEDHTNQEVPSEEKPVEKDAYSTDPIPTGKPKPVEPQDIAVDQDIAFKVKLSISCKTILNNIDRLDKNKRELVPEDGIILPLQEVTAYKGESVFDVLLREVQNNKIHMEFVHTPMYNSAYIEGIHNLYEFDVGELSGWMYKVNEWFPNYGCSRYQVQEGDVIEWVYTCNLGKDVGSR